VSGPGIVVTLPATSGGVGGSGRSGAPTRTRTTTRTSTTRVVIGFGKFIEFKVTNPIVFFQW